MSCFRLLGLADPAAMRAGAGPGTSAWRGEGLVDGVIMTQSATGEGFVCGRSVLGPGTASDREGDVGLAGEVEGDTMKQSDDGDDDGDGA